VVELRASQGCSIAWNCGGNAMKLSIGLGTALLICCLGAIATAAQQGPQQGGPPASGRPRVPQGPPSITATLDFQLAIEEWEVVGLADAMPEDKYSFAPTNGEFKGVRTFAQQAKHIGTVNNRFFNAILGQPAATPSSQFEAENGPDSMQTKGQIMQYLRDSFVLGHRTIATINVDNAFVPMKTPATPFLQTPAATVIFDCAHTMDHYGQMVEYLRDNGVVPPASRQRPPANPKMESKQ
jgi:uncharacterized damage-inducible protein DinB